VGLTAIQIQPGETVNIKDLETAVKNGTNFLGADFRGADLQGADLRDAKLQGADLREAYLRDADFRGANLQGADLQGANLQGANLRDANLRDADLRDADLQGADLRDAKVRGANLRDAYLQDANLQGADLRGADLQGAKVQGADLRGADLRDANLQGAKIDYLTMGVQEAPQGELLAYKKVAGHLVLLRIPREAARSCATTRKYRAEYAEVICIKDLDGREVEEVRNEDRGLTYRVGELVFPDSWDEDRWNECSHGIHFFLTEEEARAWIS
jgi:hypothetical protein